jgi:hypothetical protein
MWKDDLQRLFEPMLAALIVVLLIVAACLTMTGCTEPIYAGVVDWKTTDEVKMLEDEIARLETELRFCRQGLAQYTGAAGVIVVREDGQCAAEWFDMGRDLNCGTSWGRFNLPNGRVKVEIP